MRLRGRNAIVTGSSRGIGKAIALRFAEEGANVVVNHLAGEEEGERTLAEIRSKGVEAIRVEADVGKSEDVRRLVATALETFGTLDILVNNAGMGLTKPFATIQEHEWERVMAVHLNGVFLATQLAGEAMRKRQSGSIINIASVAGKVALPHRVIYSTVEGGKMMFTSSLACEWASWGIRVNAIAPGTIMTDLVRRNFQLGLLDSAAVLERTPLKRFGETAEVASVAAFLASDESSYVTGQTIFVDGGWTSWAGWPLPGEEN
jgi:NAD(P)-dependent dehydrogenase (short-subunit alcohol dehydrogenase family)